MSRFPFVPGAGAKAIKNPIYWNRLYLQEESYKNRSLQRQSRYEKQKAAINRFNVYWQFLNSVYREALTDLIPLVNKNNEHLPESNIRKLNELIQVVLKFENELESNIEESKFSDLNKFRTRIKNMILHLVKMLIKEEILISNEFELEGVTYDTQEQEISAVSSDGLYYQMYPLYEPDMSLSQAEEMNAKSRREFEKLIQEMKR